MTADAILFGVVCGLAAGTLFALLLGIFLLIERLSDAIKARRQRAAQADEIALSIQFGGASDFQHDNGGAR